MKIVNATTREPVAFRCEDHPDKHHDVPAINSNAPEGAECAMCVAEALVRAYEKTFEKSLLWPIVEMAKGRLNLLAFGAGDAFQDEARAQVNAAKLLTEADEDLRPPDPLRVGILTLIMALKKESPDVFYDNVYFIAVLRKLLEDVKP